MIEAKNMFTNLKQQPIKLMSKKAELLQEAEEVQTKINQIEDNLEITNKFIKSEELTMKLNEEQI